MGCIKKPYFTTTRQKCNFKRAVPAVVWQLTPDAERSAYDTSTYMMPLVIDESKWRNKCINTGNIRRATVTMSCVRVTIVAVERQYVLIIVSLCLYSCLSYPASKSHFFCAALYCHLWPVWLYNIFSHYLINGTIFGEKLLNIKRVFIFYATLKNLTV
jgi:hypothetical protein